MKIRLRLFRSKKEAVRCSKDKQPIAGLFSNNFWRAATLFTIFLRLIIPPFIFFQPLLIFIIIGLIDWIDFPISMNTGMKSREYQIRDKLLDLNSQFFMMLYGLKTAYFQVFLFLFFYRLLGTIIYFVTQKRIFFLLFPNLVEVIFLTYLLSFRFGFDFSLTLGVLFIFKMIQEIQLIILEKKISLGILEINIRGKSLQIQIAGSV